MAHRQRRANCEANALRGGSPREARARHVGSSDLHGGRAAPRSRSGLASNAAFTARQGTFLAHVHPWTQNAMHADARGQSPMLPSGSTMPVTGDIIADKYRVEAVLGRGGMSVVYRATHLELDQQVAIKVLSAEALLLPEYVVRLKREARAVSRIRSEHVVRVYDIGELPSGGVPYLVMECLSGLDLAAVLARQGPFPIDLAVEYVLQACEALAEAHALGIIHRDLKPANLFLTEAVDGSPRVKVLDFGISRMSRRHGLSALTDPGTVLGTPSYMAPEQMEAADTVDARADIWALGTILYELLVGKPPYTGESLPQIFMKIMRSKTPKASAVRADVPSGIDAIIARCLEIDAPERFQTVAELAWALSTVGTPHARDSAARISRVFDKQSSEHPEATPSGTLRSTVPPPVVNGVARCRYAGARKRSGARHTVAAIASAAVLGAASVFGVLALRGAVDASVAHAPAYEQPAPGTRASEDAAVAIAPRMRPAAAPLAVPLVVAPAAAVPAAAAAVMPAPIARTASHATLVAAPVPGPSPRPASLPAPAPASKPGAAMAGALAAEPLRAAEPTGGAAVRGGDPTHGGGEPAVSPAREESTPPPNVE
jgi:serine/threonine protein kinase